MAVRFEWDKNKNRSNLAKHGIEFDAAVGVFADPNSVMRFDREIGDDKLSVAFPVARWLSSLYTLWPTWSQ